MHAPIEKTNALLFRFFEDLLEQNRRHRLPRPSNAEDRDARFEREASAADDRHQFEKEQGE